MEKPATGITEITVINQDTSIIRVTVTGEVGVPTVKLFDSQNEGLVFAVTNAASTAQQPTTTPPTQQKPIELEVTAPPDTYRVNDATTTTKTHSSVSRWFRGK